MGKLETNGTVKWLTLSVVAVSILIAAVLAFANVKSMAAENCRRIEAIEANNGRVLYTLQRIDKRQALILNRLKIDTYDN